MIKNVSPKVKNARLEFVDKSLKKDLANCTTHNFFTFSSQLEW